MAGRVEPECAGGGGLSACARRGRGWQSVAQSQKERAQAMMVEFNTAFDAHRKAKQMLTVAEAAMASSHGFDPVLLERVSELATAVTAAQGRKDAAASAHAYELEQAAALMMEVDTLGACAACWLPTLHIAP